MGEVGSVEIVIKGGRPWGFTLEGGAESRSALTVAQIEPRGKADKQGALKIGDHVLKINDVQCFSLADATQLIDCAFRTLTVLVWRSKSAVGVPSTPSRENFRSRPRQCHAEDNHIFERISSPVSPVYHGVIYKDTCCNLPPIRKDNQQSQHVVSPCHSHQGSHEWFQCDRREMSSLENIAHSSRHSGSVQSLVSDSSFASSASVRPDSFQSNDSLNRHSRSPRNLTKDSGYETSVQTEHDYVNVEWIANSQVPNRSTPLASPQEYIVPKTTTATEGSYTPDEKRPQLRGRSGCSPSSEEFAHQYSPSDNVSFSYKDCSVPSVHLRNLSASSSKCSGSFNNLYSSSESISSASSKPNAVHLRSSKSSLSLSSDVGNPVYDYQQVLTSCRQYSRSVVTPAQSTPDLNCYDKMIPRRTSKKHSIYEELASKSGFDFSPMIQRQPSRFQKGAVKGQSAIVDSYLPYANKQIADLSEDGEKPKTPSVYRHYYDSGEDVNQVFHETEVALSLPPPVPARDSSLRYRSTSAHEKFPSWPVSLPVETETNRSPVHSSGYRSNSWTEQTRCAKDTHGSYSRPKNHYHISTQQLHPVQEKSKKSAEQQNDRPKSESMSKEAGDSFSNDNPATREPFNILSQHFKFDCNHQKTENHINTHSPPERDTITPVSFKKEQSKTHYDASYDRSPSVLESSNLYENVRRNGNSCQITTPLLDRLRLEREVLPDSWPQCQDSETRSETGSCMSSNSSSQETLKWHGSFSDLSSMYTFTQNESPALESDTNSMHGESFNMGSTDGSMMSYSTEYSSPSEYFTQSNKANLNLWAKSSISAYAVSDVVCVRQNVDFSAREDEQEEANGNKPSVRDDSRQHSDSGAEGSTSRHNSSYNSHMRHVRYSSHEARRTLEDRARKTTAPHCSSRSDNKVGSANNKCSSNDRTQEKTRHRAQEHHQQTNSSVPDKRDSRCGSNHRTSHPSRVVFSKSDNNEILETNNKISLELKAIQKQAVLSFYHRQTTIASKDFIEKKGRSSSFSYSHETSTSERTMSAPVAPISQQQRRRMLSSNSFSQPFTQEFGCKPTAIVSANYGNRPCEISHDQQSFARESPTSEMSFSSPSDKYGNELYTPPSIYGSNTTLESKDPDICDPTDKQQYIEAVSLTKDLANQTANKSTTTKSFGVQPSGRKALLQKTYNSNDDAVVKITSSVEEINVQNFLTTNSGKSITKPQVPPKRINSDVSVPHTMPENLLSSSILIQDCFEEELQVIEENAKKYQISLPHKVCYSLSPDLPLPPHPPINTGNDISSLDDPFPPPPDPIDFDLSLIESECLPHCCDQDITITSKEDSYLPLSSNTFSFEDIPSKLRVTDIPTSKDQDPNLLNFTVNTSLNEKSSQPLTKNSNVEVGSTTCISQDVEPLINECENEAIYVNLYFQRELCSKPITNTGPKPFVHLPSSVSFTNTATQTSENTPSMPRKNKSSRSTRESDDYESLTLGISRPTNQSMLSENSPTLTMVSNDTDEILTSENRSPSYQKDVANFNISSCTSDNTFIERTNGKAFRTDSCLPLTCPYFTTSEPKAKLLTRYYQSLDNNGMDQTELKGQKEELIESLSKKLNIMRLEQIELKDEMKQNEELGREVTAKIEKLAKPNEVQKYRVHVEESEKITNLLLSLSGRLTRAENALLILSKNTNTDEKSILEAKKKKLGQQLDEAWQLKENIDRRSYQVSLFLHHYLSKDEYADYEHFIKMKPKLLMDAREIDEKIKLGEEQLLALHGTFQGHMNGELSNKGDLTVLGNQ